MKKLPCMQIYGSSHPNVSSCWAPFSVRHMDWMKSLAAPWAFLRAIAECIARLSVKTVADRCRHVAYRNNHWSRVFNSINIDGLEWPWTPKRGFLVNFLQFLAAGHISRVNCNEMPENRPRQRAYEIFSIKRRFQQFKCRSFMALRFEEACASERKRGVPL